MKELSVEMGSDAMVNEVIRAKELTRRIHGELARAVALGAMWSRVRADKAVLATVNAANVYGFTIVREALHKDLVLNLVKLYDRGPHDLSLGRVIAIITRPKFVATIANQRALTAAQVAFQDATTGDAYKSLKLFRNKVLSHVDTREVEQTAKWGHEMALLRASIDIASAISEALGESWQDYRTIEAIWELESNRFWEAAARGIDLFS